MLSQAMSALLFFMLGVFFDLCQALSDRSLVE